MAWLEAACEICRGPFLHHSAHRPAARCPDCRHQPDLPVTVCGDLEVVRSGDGWTWQLRHADGTVTTFEHPRLRPSAEAVVAFLAVVFPSSTPVVIEGAPP